MTQPYSPATATAIVNGSTDAGYVHDTGVWWDRDVILFCLRNLSQREEYRQLDVRQNLAALRADIRAHAAISTSPAKILTVGDSITRGDLSADGTGYRGHLADLLDRRHIEAVMSINPPPPGGQVATLANTAPQVPPLLAAHQPDIVLLAIGTNDTGNTSGWQAAHLALVDTILASSPTVKVACAKLASCAVWSTVVPAGLATINTAVAANVTARQGTGRVVLADLNRPVPSPNPIRDPWMWTFDGVHPTDAGYLHIAHCWLDAVEAWLP